MCLLESRREKCGSSDWRVPSRFLCTLNWHDHTCSLLRSQTPPSPRSRASGAELVATLAGFCFILISLNTIPEHAPRSEVQTPDGCHPPSRVRNRTVRAANGHRNSRIQSYAQYRCFVFNGMSQLPSGTPIAYSSMDGYHTLICMVTHYSCFARHAER
jgi:hypothetical protein